MENFIYNNRTEIIFGKDTQKEVGMHLQKRGSKKVLLHYGGGSIKRNGVYDDVIKSLNEHNIEYVELGGVEPNPDIDLAREGSRLVKEHGLDFVLAVGGGSVIDSAKAISMGSKYDGDVWDFYVNKAVPTEFLPVATILTIPATGSESSTSTVLSNRELSMKRGLNHIEIRPIFSILNPETCYTLPVNQIAYGVTDIIAHIFERYFTNVNYTKITDVMAEGWMKVLINEVDILLKDKTDYDAWAEVMWGGTLAHNRLLDCGRIGCWGSHRIEHEISAIYPEVAHGAGLAVVFPAWMKYVYKSNIDIFVQFAVNVFGVDVNMRNQEAIALEGIARLEKFYEGMGLSTNLKDLGVKESDFEIMAEKAVMFGDIGEFVKLSKNDIVEIFKIAYK
ncbi:MAG: iron-containing alcohol dehydrogenase [Lachnospirales bacterium]